MQMHHIASLYIHTQEIGKLGSINILVDTVQKQIIW